MKGILCFISGHPVQGFNYQRPVNNETGKIVPGQMTQVIPGRFVPRHPALIAVSILSFFPGQSLGFI